MNFDMNDAEPQHARAAKGRRIPIVRSAGLGPGSRIGARERSACLGTHGATERAADAE